MCMLFVCLQCEMASQRWSRTGNGPLKMPCELTVCRSGRLAGLGALAVFLFGLMVVNARAYGISLAREDEALSRHLVQANTSTTQRPVADMPQRADVHSKFARETILHLCKLLDSYPDISHMTLRCPSRHRPCTVADWTTGLSRGLG